jgi:hypothetical protein
VDRPPIFFADAGRAQKSDAQFIHIKPQKFQ